MTKLVFDLGGVVLKFSPQKTPELIAKTKKEVKIFQDILKSDFLFEVDRGSITFSELGEILEERSFISKEKIEDFFDKMFDSLDLINETLFFIDELKAKGIKVYYLSNMSESYMQKLKTRYPQVFNKFEGGIYSAKIKKVKPEKEIFDAFTEKYNQSGDRVIFLDDMNYNIEGAIKYGWEAIQFNPEMINEIKNKVFNNL